MQEAIALAAVRGHLAHSALSFLNQAGHRGPAVAQWPYLGISPDWLPGAADPIAAQSAWFKQLGIRGDGFFRLSVQFEMGGMGETGEIEFFIERVETAAGSFFGRYRIGIALKHAGKYARDVSVALLAGIILSAGSDSGARQPPVDTPYVCTINAELAGDRQALVRSAADDLALSAEAPADTHEAVIRARQSCLRAAGFDPGPIDGVYGPRTQAAARHFAFYHGGLIVNWNSAVFRQFVVEQAMHRSAPPD